MDNGKDYSNRVIVFMDILGFKNIVLHNNKDISKKKLFKIMDYIRWIGRSNYDEVFLKQCDLGKEVTVFSDSIVISYDNTNPGQVFYILLDIIHIQLDLAAQGIILRGGVSIGEVYRDKEIVFGPGMISAYKLESEVAKYPRIIVDDEVLMYAYKNPSPQNSSQQEIEHIESLLKEDSDGYFYTDFLNQEGELDNPEDMKIVLEVLKKIINQGLKTTDEGINKKYKWLREYCNSIYEFNRIKQY